MRSSALALSLAVAAIAAMPLVARAPVLQSSSWALKTDDVPEDDGEATERATTNAISARSGRLRPELTLWAWERPEDLRFLRASRIAVAPLIATVTVPDDEVLVTPRRQPIELPAGADVTAVVRVEIDPARPPQYSAEQRAQLVDAIVDLASSGTFTALQIDFDAPRSARPFYRRLLLDLRAALPAHARLSMTALASWCLGDPWLEHLPVDEVVPMVFRMGGDARAVRQHLQAGGDFQPACRSAIGIATDEPLSPLPAGRRLYAFSASAWTADDVRSLFRQAENAGSSEPNPIVQR